MLFFYNDFRVLWNTSAEIFVTEVKYSLQKKVHLLSPALGDKLLCFTAAKQVKNLLRMLCVISDIATPTNKNVVLRL